MWTINAHEFLRDLKKSDDHELMQMYADIDTGLSELSADMSEYESYKGSLETMRTLVLDEMRKRGFEFVGDFS